MKKKNTKSVYLYRNDAGDVSRLYEHNILC